MFHGRAKCIFQSICPGFQDHHQLTPSRRYLLNWLYLFLQSPDTNQVLKTHFRWAFLNLISWYGLVWPDLDSIVMTCNGWLLFMSYPYLFHFFVSNYYHLVFHYGEFVLSDHIVFWYSRPVIIAAGKRISAGHLQSLNCNFD